MKKVLAILMMAVAMLAMTSCKDKLGVVYNVAIDGNASGDVVVTFPNGDLELNGETALLFHYSNETDTTPVVEVVDPNVVTDTTSVLADSTAVAELAEGELLLGAALTSEDKDVRTFATAVNDGFSVSLKDAKAGGSYHVHIYGYAKEPNTGIVIVIDKSFDYPEVTE